MAEGVPGLRLETDLPRTVAAIIVSVVLLIVGYWIYTEVKSMINATVPAAITTSINMAFSMVGIAIVIGVVMQFLAPVIRFGGGGGG